MYVYTSSAWPGDAHALLLGAGSAEFVSLMNFEPFFRVWFKYLSSLPATVRQGSAKLPTI